jgi:hypothetical protein
MSRSSYSLPGLISLALVFVACGGEDDSENDAGAVVEADAAQGEAGTVIGRGRGGGGMEERDGGEGVDGAQADASVDAGQTVDGAGKADAMIKVDASASCPSACAEINSRYEAAVKVAQGCLTTGTNQCALSEPNSLMCGRNIPVGNNGTLNTIQKEWESAKCEPCKPKLCLGVVAPIGKVFCKKNDGAAQALTAQDNPIAIDPIVILPPISRNDGTCTSAAVLTPL